MADERMINPMQICDAFLWRFVHGSMHRMHRIVPFEGQQASKGMGQGSAMERATRVKMRTGISVAFVVACCLTAGTLLYAQTPTNAPAPPQSKPSDTQKPPANAPKPTEANPFPDNTNSVPVMPNATSPATAEPTWDGTSPENVRVPGVDSD